MESIESQKATIKKSLVLEVDSKADIMAKQEDDIVPMKFLTCECVIRFAKHNMRDILCYVIVVWKPK